MDENRKKKLTITKKIGYGLGDAGGCLTFVLMGTIFSKYCTDALGIDTTLLGSLWIIWNVWDFINDPMMGVLMDKSFLKSRNKKGKFRPWLLRSAPLICVTFIALFSVPQFFEGVALVCCLFVLKILYELTYTMFNIPMGSLLSAMSNDDEERASLSVWRGIGSGIGNMLPSVLAPIFIKMYGDTNAIGYAIAGVVCAVIGLVLCLMHYFMTTENNVDEIIEPEKQDIKFSDIVKVFKVNRPFVALCLHGLFICLMQYASNNISSYMFSDVLGDIELMSLNVAVSAPFMTLIFVFGTKLAKKLGLENMIRYSLLASSFLYVSLFVVMILFDIHPWVYMIWSGAAMGVASVSIYMQWGLVGEAIDYNEMVTGKRTEGSIYGTFNLSRRIGQTIGTSLSLFLLDAFGYNSKALIQTSTTIFGIKFICILIPGIFVLGSWIAFKFVWNINSKTRNEIKNYKENQTVGE